MFTPLSADERLAKRAERATQSKVPLVPVPEDAPPMRFRHPKHGEPFQTWAYHTADGQVVGYVCRWNFVNAAGEPDKDYLPVCFCELGDGRRAWRSAGFPSPRALYRLPTILAKPDALVLVTEGEKACESAQKLFADAVATTPPHGAKSPHKADWRPLRDRRVVIWPDHDQAGDQFSERIVRLARDAGTAEVRVVQVPDWFPAKWDLADPAPEGSDLQELLNSAKEYPSEDPKKCRGSQPTDNKGQKGLGTPLDLPAPEPWPEPVDGAELLDQMVCAIRRHVVLSASAADTISLWVLASHALDTFFVFPRIVFRSPEKGCGKTTALTVLSCLVTRPLFASSITPAAIFRAVELACPTLLVDEADSFVRSSDELRGILNSGHSRRTAKVVRTVGERHEPRSFSTWCAMAIAGIGRLPDTLEDRSIIVTLQRRTAEESVERLRPGHEAHLDELCQMAARWASDNFRHLEGAEPTLPDGLVNRAADNWEPLIAVAELAGGEWPQRAQKAAQSLSQGADQEDGSQRVMLLHDIREAFESKRREHLPTTELLDCLIGMQERPWCELSKGREITASQLARRLRPFGIRPKVIRVGDTTFRGYQLDQFKEAFSRYLQSYPSQRHNPQKTAKNPGSLSVTEGFGVTDRKSLKPAESLTCDGVTDSYWGNGFAHVSDADDDGDGDAEERAAIMAEQDDLDIEPSLDQGRTNS